MITSFYDFSIR